MMNLSMTKKYKNKQLGTFFLNKQEPIHRWYTYHEGYSCDFIYKELELLPIEPKRLFEPFAGSGTTPLVASILGIVSYYTEMNPFMRFVVEAKTTVLKSVLKKENVITDMKELLALVASDNFVIQEINAQELGGFEKFYESDVIKALISIKKRILKNNDEDFRKITLLALAAITVKVSKMKKHGDLRYAKKHEKKESDFNVKLQFCTKLAEIIHDIELIHNIEFAETHCIGNDARTAILPELADCIITSPPYLNGTNYIRNTKLELNLLDFILNEKELKTLYSEGIIAGINNVSKRRIIKNYIPELEPIIEKLKLVEYDPRITKMVIGYFNDMEDFFKNASQSLRNNGFLILDIGDSQFAGIHIETDTLLTRIATKYGFLLYDVEVLRTRRSKNQMLLSQKVLRYQFFKKDGED